MRNISFALTLDAFKAGKKDITRRLGWLSVKSGDRLMGVEKAQGIKKGGLVRLGVIEVVSVRREPLNAMLHNCWQGLSGYGEAETIREGFPTMGADDFVAMFCEHNGCLPFHEVTRIEFVRIGICIRCAKVMILTSPDLVHCFRREHNSLTCAQVIPLIHQKPKES